MLTAFCFCVREGRASVLLLFYFSVTVVVETVFCPMAS